MKKYVKIIGLMSMAVLFAISTSSCKKSEEENAEFTVTLGQMHEDLSSRAYIDLNGQFLWNESDQIMVYNLASNGNSVARVYTALPGAEGQTTTRFKGRPMGTKKDLGFRYFYPASKASGVLDNNRETFTVSNSQVYNSDYLADPTALVLAGSVNSLSDDIVLNHIFGILNLRINTTRTDSPCVKEIIVEDNVFNLSGDLSLNLGAIENSNEFTRLLGLLESNDASYASAMSTYLQQIGYYEANNGAGKIMTLDCSQVNNGQSQGVMLTSSPKRFRVVLRPGALYRGFKVTIKFMDDTIQDLEIPYAANVQNVIKPGYFTTFDITVD